MSEIRAVRNVNRCPGHPGALLSDLIPATGKTKVELANLPGISRQQLYDIINEREARLAINRRPSRQTVRRRCCRLACDAVSPRCVACGAGR